MDRQAIIEYLSELSGIPPAALSQFFAQRKLPITEGLTADQALLNKLLDDKDRIINEYKKLEAEELAQKHSPRPTTPATQNGVPLIGKKNAMVRLRDEYKNPTIISKIDDFEQQGFKHFRSIRGDGNCFYRSVATGLIECMIKNENLYEHIFAVLQHQKEGLDKETYGHLLTFMQVVDGIHNPPPQRQIEDANHVTPSTTEPHHPDNELIAEGVSTALSPKESVNCFQVPDSRESGEEESLVDSQRDEDSMVIVDDKEDESEPLIPKQEEDDGDVQREDRHTEHNAAPAYHFRSNEIPSSHPPTLSVTDWQFSPNLTTITKDFDTLSTGGTHCTSPRLSREAEDIPSKIHLEDQTNVHVTYTADRIVPQEAREQELPSKNEVPQLEPAVPVAKADIEALSEQYATNIELSQWFVKAFRQLSAFALQRDPMFAYYLTEGQTIDSLRETALKMGEDAEQLQMIALFSILKIGCQAFQLDRGNNNASYTLPDESATPLIYLLFRPGHYDLLYRSK